MINPALVFEGKPCERAGHTLRYKASRACVACQNVTIQRWKENNRDKTRKAYADYKARNAEKVRKASRERWRKKLGMPTPTRTEPSGCEICGNTNVRGTLHLDHCHDTNKFRGWLCFNCNSGIGSFKDNTIILSKAIEYLNAVS